MSETAEEVEEELERWRAIIENKGLIISRSKTEYLVPSHQQGVGPGEVRRRTTAIGK